MELHLAIKNILKYQGEDFLLDPKMINALIDFQAYDQHPALKNIFRTLHQDGYIKIVKDAGKWDASCDQIVYEVERDYAFPHDLVEYIMKSVAVGLRYNCEIPLILNQKKRQDSMCHASVTERKNWSKMSELEKANFIESKMEIKEDTFSQNNLTLKNYSVSDIWQSGSKYSFEFGFELANTGKTKDLLEICFAVYDENGKLRTSDSDFIFQEINGFYTDSTTVNIMIPFQNIHKIAIYMKS